MSAFSGEGALSQLFGFAGVWVASRSNLVPRIQLDDTSIETTGAAGIAGTSGSTILRIAVAVLLVLFQTLLVGANLNAKWTIPLLSLGVYALTRKGDFDLTSIQSYTVIRPSDWTASKLDVRSPLIAPVTSVVVSLLLLWASVSRVGSLLQALLLLVLGLALFTVLSRSAGGVEATAEKSSSEKGQNFLRHVSLWACGTSGVLFVLMSSGKYNALNVLTIFEIALRGGQALGLIVFAVENALAGASALTVASIAGTILSNPTTVPGISYALALSGSVMQLALTAPKSNDKRIALLALLFLPGLLLPGMQNVSIAPSTVIESVSQAAFAQLHPIQQLHGQWSRAFEEKLARQSRTVDQAIAEYKDRYNRNPPAGFETWFQLAQDNNYVMIDEFDTLMKSLEPFWDVSPSDLLTRMRSLNENGEEFAEMEVQGGKIVRQSSDHWYTGAVVEWFDKFSHLKLLHDFNFTMNVFDEPRSIFSPAHLENTNSPTQATDPIGGVDKDDVTFIEASQKPLWPEIAPSCPNGGRSQVNDESAYTFKFKEISFLNAPPSAQDVCVSKSLREQHGFFLSPDTMKITHNVVPIFSQAAPRRYSDIVFPTPFYYTSVDGDKHDSLDDIPWTEKKNQTYWAGGSTGGHATLENWKHIQRVRLALMTAPESNHPVVLLKKTTLKKWKSFTTWFATIAELFDIKITRLVQCEEAACHKMESTFEPLSVQPANASMNYKYVFDIDGNSYTGRYYRLLHSNGCVIKSTIFREWHDDILTPWVHFIPLSNGAEEFGEMMRFLIQEPEGDAVGKEIAVAGKRWANKSLRKEDMEMYALRVFLEYARLLDEEQRKVAKLR